MKLIFSVLAALLAVTTFALPQGEPKTACTVSDIPPGAICDGDHVITPSGQSYDEIDDTYDPNTAYGRYISSNLTLATSATDDVFPEYAFKAEIFMDGAKQHVGTFHKQYLYNKIYACLNQLCPVSLLGCRKDFNKLASFGTYDTCRIYHTIYHDHEKNRLANNAYLDVIIRSSRFSDDTYYAGIKRAMYELVAGMYAVMTERQENCYEVDAPGTRSVTFCNISPHVLVGYPSNALKYPPYIAVSVTFNGKTTDHGLNCEASRAPVTDFFDRASREDFANAIGVKVPEVVSSVACKMDDGCMRYATREQCYPWTDGSKNQFTN